MMTLIDPGLVWPHFPAGPCASRSLWPNWNTDWLTVLCTVVCVSNRTLCSLDQSSALYRAYGCHLGRILWLSESVVFACKLTHNFSSLYISCNFLICVSITTCKEDNTGAIICIYNYTVSELYIEILLSSTHKYSISLDKQYIKLKVHRSGTGLPSAEQSGLVLSTWSYYLHEGTSCLICSPPFPSSQGANTAASSSARRITPGFEQYFLPLKYFEHLNEATCLPAVHLQWFHCARHAQSSTD